MSLLDKLNTAKGIDNGTIKPRQATNPQAPTFNESQIEHLDDLVFGSNVSGDVDSGYDPNREMEMIKNMNFENLDNCSLPDAIKESFIKNPPQIGTVDPQMDAFTEQLGSKLGGSAGLEASAGIISRLEEQDRQKYSNKRKAVSEQKTVETGGIDYGLIKMIVEGAINEKLGELKGVLNESVSKSSSPNITAMKMADKFLFLDSDNNVWECVMKYRGKNKKKK